MELKVGKPEARASTTALEQGSKKVGRANMSMACKKVGMSLTRPKKCTR